ncbi:mucin-like protein [Alternaria alternata]|nr:mucin-like protein [Alternaria alternata]
MKSKVKGTILPLQQAEFDALPYSVQRKYFSSLERLQIRQQASDEPTSGRSSQASTSSKSHRPSLSLGTGRRRRKSEKAVQSHDISHVELDFFLSLPEKVRKQHFSREEQALLQQRHQQALLPDDQDIEWAQQRFNDFRFDFPSPPVDLPERGRSRRRSSSASSTVSPSRPSFGPSATLGTSKDRNRHLLYLDTMATPMFTRREMPIDNMRRTMSLTSHPVHHGSSYMSDPPFFNARPRGLHQRAHSSSLASHTLPSTPSPLVVDTEATHYQDPEARKKLRMYLASPQKFDEAIEFGFPSSAGNDSATPHFQLPQIDNHARKFSRDMQTFLRDGQLSFFEDNNENQGLESDAGSVADMDSPATPSSTGLSFRMHSRQISHRKFSVESPAPSPVHSANGQFNREMTLRMTLTRPDLRADEDQLYGWQSSSPKAPKDDPLALEDLVFTDDMTGTKGAFYVKPKPRGNLVSRLLKRASLKATSR